MDWKPRAKGELDLRLPLTSEEGFLLSRADGETSVSELAAQAGMDEARAREIFLRLVAHGAIEDVPVSSGDRHALEENAVEDLMVLGPEHEVTEEEAPVLGPAHEVSDEEVQGERTHRALYESELHPLHVEERIGLAKRETGARLLALCFDPEPRVIHAIFENAQSGLDHARLVAMHHHNPAGLEAIVSRAAFARDGEVVRRLLRNVQTSDAQLRRVLDPKILRDVYKVVISKDVSERTRVRAREIFHTKFVRATPDERFDLIWSTEGRVLLVLPTAPLDSRTTQILCSRPIASVMLVQNLAKWRSTNPQILTHLLKQPLVKRQPGLRKLVLAHPNVSAEVKRRGGL